MKFEIAALLAVGVSARNTNKNWKVWLVDALYHPITGGHI